MRWSWIEGARGKVHPSRAGSDTARGRPVGGPGGRAALRRSADAARSPLTALRGRAAALPTVGLPPPAGPTEVEHRHAPRPAAPHPAPPLGSGSHAWPPLAATPAKGAEATWRDGGDRPTGVGGRRRAARWAAITRARRQPPSRSPEIETLGTGSCRCENLGACDRSRACSRSCVSARAPAARRYQRIVARASAP